MKARSLRLSYVLAATAFATPAFADPAPAPARPAIALGADAIAVLPIGDYANAVSVGVGALGRVELAIGPGALTGRVGVIAHATKTDASLTFVPIYAGYRLPIGDAGLYAAGELGVTMAFASAAGASSNDQKLGLTGSVGLRRGALDLRAGLILPDVEHLTGLFASVGYDFVGL